MEQTDRQGQLTSRMTNDVAAVVQPVRQIMCLACSSAGASEAPGEMILKMTFHNMLVACWAISAVFIRLMLRNSYRAVPGTCS